MPLVPYGNRKFGVSFQKGGEQQCAKLKWSKFS